MPAQRDRLVAEIEAQMRENSRVGDEIQKAHPSHPAFYALNRAWHQLVDARDALANEPQRKN